MNERRIHILWDESHIWGFLAIKACLGLQIPYTLINSRKITQGELFRKPTRDLLLAPGGSCRLKAQCLASTGLEKIRQWVLKGGSYLGFCGGAGLALSGTSAALNLCPWKRQKLADRSDHSLSGAVIARLANDELLTVPVWWPGRFAAGENPQVEVLAVYHAPGQLEADAPGVNVPYPISKKFPAGQPLSVFGQAGNGCYLLSYAHLETPGWGKANAWLAELLKDKFKIQAGRKTIPAWNIFQRPQNVINTQGNRDMLATWEKLAELMKTGFRKGLFQSRESWLPHWRDGMPGIICASLLASSHFLAEYKATENALDTWHTIRSLYNFHLEEFLTGAGNWFTAFPQDNNREFETATKERLFGHPMRGGGLAATLLALQETLLF